MTINEKAVKAELPQAFEGFVGVRCYYEKAPKNAAFPYIVVKGLHTSPLNAGDVITFTVELYTEETAAGASDEMEALRDKVRNAADGALLTDNENFYGHINFDSSDDGSLDAEYDLAHRQMFFSLRLLYFQGG